ncbi:hypothetical protein MXB_770 [Myxobolus squamalis]|nr:hypothetical protein MXB_770 [Myxobolus squamalis]
MPKISIQFELEDEKDSDKFEKNKVKGIDCFQKLAASPKCKNANMRKIKRHHGIRNYEKIEIKSFDDVNFSSGNPKMEINRGIIHLYKEKSCGKPESNTLCLLSVPTVISCAEIVDFCSSFSSPSPGLYLSVIKFDDHLAADQFYDHYQGKPIDPNNKLTTCNLAYVESVTYLPSNKISDRPSSQRAQFVLKEWYSPIDESLEGILTVLCDHSFHTECLIKWPDIKLRCLFTFIGALFVGTFSPQPLHLLFHAPTAILALISGCVLYAAIWDAGGMKISMPSCKLALPYIRHFEETAHTFSIKIGTSQVWDYAGDNYVHRLISCTDGKLVECSNEERDSLDNKIESLKLEVIIFPDIIKAFTQSNDQIKELEDQISDLMKHFEMSHTIQSLETTKKNVSTLLNKHRKFQKAIL